MQNVPGIMSIMFAIVVIIYQVEIISGFLDQNIVHQNIVHKKKENVVYLTDLFVQIQVVEVTMLDNIRDNSFVVLVGEFIRLTCS